jgi:hypothetical protein
MRAGGLGVYAFFRDAVVSLQSAIEVPASVEGGLTATLPEWTAWVLCAIRDDER